MDVLGAVRPVGNVCNYCQYRRQGNHHHLYVDFFSWKPRSRDSRDTGDEGFDDLFVGKVVEDGEIRRIATWARSEGFGSNDAQVATCFRVVLVAVLGATHPSAPKTTRCVFPLYEWLAVAVFLNLMHLDQYIGIMVSSRREDADVQRDVCH